MANEFEEIVELGPEDVTEEEPLPVVVEARVAERPSVRVPALQAAGAAATGFVAGAVTLALLRRQHSRRLARLERRALIGRRGPWEGTARTYLVHVRVLGRPAD